VAGGRKIIKSGFTLIELLVVISLLTLILSIVVVAVNPAEQLSKAADASAKTVVNDFVKSVIAYYGSQKKLPWEKNQNCHDELNAGEPLTDIPNCIRELVGDGNLAETYLAAPESREIFITKCGDSAVLCYDPKSKTENEAAETKYDKFGVGIPGCPGQNRNSPDCYWCRPLMKSEDCLIEPTPTVTPTPTSIPTPTPTPANPWGQAAVFGGKVPGRNPPTYLADPQYMKAQYSSLMNLPTNNVTVEAWIKPAVPAAAGFHYRIVDNTYRLSMDAKPEGQNVSYQYYFDIQSSNNGCNQTVVYSGSCSWNPWDTCNYINVTPAQFTTWKHIAGVLQNGNLHIYENGIKLNSYNVGMIVCNAGRSMHVGAGVGTTYLPYYDYFQGAIDEVRVSKNARYTSNFTPPGQPFTPDANTMMLYHFDSNTTDSSGNNLNGQLTGNVYYIPSTIPVN
jgi:prepilin-type N-terminal cleavage/methylation domain-containing protein